MAEDKEDIRKMMKIIDASDNIVFMDGAGTSTESGIKDFRGKNGLYTEAKEVDTDSSPEYNLSVGCLCNEPEKFFDYFRGMKCFDAEPNSIHMWLRQLQAAGKLKAVVTQNIDGLHKKAGLDNVYEIHGTTDKCYCMKCYKEYSLGHILGCSQVPRCSCGGVVRPDVVLYGEMLPQAYSYASYYILKADVLIVAGTSLTVNPAKGLLNLYQGKHLIIMNEQATLDDEKAELVINRPIREIVDECYRIREVC